MERPDVIFVDGAFVPVQEPRAPLNPPLHFDVRRARAKLEFAIRSHLDFVAEPTELQELRMVVAARAQGDYVALPR